MDFLIKSLSQQPNDVGKLTDLNSPWKESPQLSLALDSNPELDGVRKNDIPLIPGGALHGHLDITCRRSFHVRRVSIFLEGILRSWVPTAVGMAERKFLSQALDIPTSEISAATVSTKGFCLSIPFYFIISRTMPSSDSQSPEHCLQLPPSIELSRVTIDSNSRKQFAQPSITYALRAAVDFAAENDAIKPPVESSLPLVLSPHTKEFPPTDTLDFPAEFKLRELKPFRWSVFGRKLGTMTVTMSEPRPLNYDASSLRSSTECHLQLEFSPIGSEDIHHGFQAMKSSIYSLIRVKTFYSVKSFARLPSQTLASDGGKTGLRNELVKLETREIPHVAWAYNFSRDSASPRTSRGSSADSIINENGAGPSSGPANPPQSPSGK
ncbi:hypothetical protein BKA61DRAFT_575309 [Leptodontidium sp. MPI-SDFR-AT-0119]|nr:hypothetical protein BKA61DRAFT_575309 [Leptodontidium sp. MPI-SDFR-AT-0119]